MKENDVDFSFNKTLEMLKDLNEKQDEIYKFRFVMNEILVIRES